MKKKMNEEKIMGILYANFRGKTKKVNNWIYLANKIKELSDHYGSHKKVAENLGMSPETIRETLKLLELPKEVQEMVKSGKLKHEVAWRIASIEGEKGQILIAKEVLDLDTHDGRDVVRIYKKNPSMNIKTLVEKIKKSKNQIEQINLMVLPIRKLDYDKIKRVAKKIKINPEKFVLEKIINKWIEENR